ncbi:MAG: DUF2007 domain-containing protein [Planctomycetaceae bacterium]
MTDIVEVYCCANETEGQLLTNMLADHGISAQLVGQLLQGAIGEIPAGPATAPRILVQASDRDHARSLIADYEARGRETRHQIPTRGWTCPRCGTDIEADFDVCWNCLYNPSAC